MLKVTVSRRGIGLQAIEQRLRSEVWNRFAPVAEAIIEREQARHFDNQASPDGKKWAPLKGSTLARSLSEAKSRVGGKVANPKVTTNKAGLTKVIARNPIVGKQKTAVVRRTANSQILVDTGLLRASITASGSGSVRMRHKNVLIVGTRVKYAAAHQYGVAKRNLPARPFVGMSKQGMSELAVSFKQAVIRELRG